MARSTIRELAKDAALRHQITSQVIAWEDPEARTPMLAIYSPQEAIDKGLPKPSECDIVVVIFWSKFGTPLDAKKFKKEDGSPYLSGTEWEYEDAIRAYHKNGRPLVVVYRRMEVPEILLNDPERAEKIEQYDRVDKFFATFKNPDGSWRFGYNEYHTPAQFQANFEADIKALIHELLKNRPAAARVDTPVMPTWTGSPFPGLRAFTPEDAPIFFGREHETDALVRQVQKSRFVTVVGASGSGKSSLVGAGLLPRLKDNAIQGSKDWHWVRFTPGEMSSGNPFEALVVALRELAPLKTTPVRDLTRKLQEQPEVISQLCAPCRAHPWSEIVLLIDQFEELFTLVPVQYREPFIHLLAQASQSDFIRLVVTLRADFYEKCVENADLAALMHTTTFPLAAPKLAALHKMITRPALAAGLRFEEGLVQQILDDTGSEPGSLPLMAYALDELYLLCKDQGDLTFQAYESFGGVQGAIGTRAENTFLGLDEAAQAALPQVFLKLVDLDDEGVATRQRTKLKYVVTNEVEKQLVDALTSARLLVQSFGEDRQPVIEVAHEALFRSWERLGKWLEEAQSDIRYQQRLRHDTKWWVDNGKRPDDLYRGAKLEEALNWVQRNRSRVTEKMSLFIETSQVVEQREQAKSALNTAILDSVEVGVIQADPDGKVIQVSPAAEQILQVAADQFVSQPITQFAHQFSGSVIKWQEALERWNTTPQLDSDFIEDILRFQSRTFNIRLSPVKKHQQFLGVLLVVREVKDSKESDVLNSQLFSMISHDLRSPMAAIKGYVDLMQTMGDELDAERRGQFLETISRAANRMFEMLDQLLDISRVASGIQDFYPEAVNFAVYCQQYLENFQKSISSHQFVFTQSVSCGEAKVDLDIRRFERVLSNLLSNAVKYSPEGSMVRMHVDCGKETTSLRISDEGIGIPIDDQNRLFQRFSRASNVGRTAGTGLGLTIVKQLVELHRGTITFESNEGKGTTFVVTLPNHQP